MVYLKAQCLLAAAYIAVAAAAACTSDLLVDDLSNTLATNRNNLGSWTSDDASMTSISASGGILSFTPKSGAYFYETFPCQALQADSYTHVQLDIKAPVSGAAFTVQLSSASSCSATTNTKTAFRVTGLTGGWQTVRIPLSSFAGANLNAALSLVMESFSSTQQWQLDKISFVCGQGPTTSATNAPTQATSTPAPSSSLSTSPGCSPLLVDDWASQSRLDFLGYNALLLPTGHDGTMQSVLVNNYHVTLTPKSTSSYFYSQVGCVDATKFGGIALRIKAPAGTTFKIELSSKTTCDGAATASSSQTTAQLGWTFDGTERLHSFPWSKFSGLNLSKLRSIVISAPSQPLTLGPLALYCGSTPSAWTPPSTTSPASPTETVPAPVATVSGFVIDTFGSASTNSLGFWHGGEDMGLSWGSNRVTINAKVPDYAFTTLVSNGCRDLRSYSGSYLHVAYSGHTKFSVSLQQHNSQCNSGVAPYPETRDSLEAARYAKGNDIYIPISHFNINLQRVSSVAIRGVYSAEPLVLTKIEIVPSIPSGVTIPQKLPSGTLVFACTRPNSFAFGIDDGNPKYAARLAQIIRDAGIKVTFFAVGAVLENPSTGMASLYQQLKSEGHQIALHSHTHPRMEGLPSIESIDWEYNEDYRVMENIFGERSNYFRPPFGVEGARMRQRWAAASRSDKAYLVNWSVDVQDWLWAETSTPEKQLDAFNSDVAKGGNLVVMHFSYNSTVNYFPEFIRQAKATGKQIMRIDQCMEDPNAPPL
ncbi:polysaccharide deacetylase [Colletotrichum higginsianum]|uniref:Polysaccharide deacetylase n=2 Tax=Colletotrichum higginsianum TaxID=80884 RepID=H1V6B9_COLHI|nr:Polysaccharide deacetylase [Colletotrichum higginsianum IMI 349063]OBR11350.1 Polysaccharide deacetylase [Colletotrichum higginsianum IMI 349063]TIC99120.1 Chitin deacetylase [Colletotrichum higginsianum]CCF35771.1 polysaccharide deacetylase [Colletotrichum higginsianum]